MSYLPIPGSNDDCLCGKAKPFKQCCGSSKKQRPPPHGVLLRRGFMPAPICDKLVAYAKKCPSEWLGVQSVNEDGQLEEGKLDPGRRSKLVDLGEKDKVIIQWINKICATVVSEFYGSPAQGFEQPYLTSYEKGGYQNRHSDAGIYHAATGEWNQTLNRDFSLLLYLNDEFEGGCIHFNHFNYTYKPKKGDLLLFPSEGRYEHEAQLITGGIRYVIISFGIMEGWSRVAVSGRDGGDLSYYPVKPDGYGI